jgi:SAM-dependent methyltransferase
MGQEYGRARSSNPALVFRYQTRALIAARMFRTFGRTGGPVRVLDLGAAEGRTMGRTHTLLNAAESIGIEYAQELIDLAELPPGCILIRGDATARHTEVQDRTFDLVTALAVLEHVENPEELARRACDALKPGGVFVATCPSGIWDRTSGSLGLHNDEHHTGAFDRGRFEAVAVAAGLVPKLYRRFMLAPVGVLPYLGIPVGAATGLAIDLLLWRIPIVNLAMVNQVFVATRPLSSR